MARNTLRLSLIALSAGMACAAQAQDMAALASQREATLARLTVDSGSIAQVSIQNATGAVRFLRAAPGGKLGAQRSARATNDAGKQGSSTQFLSNYGSLFGVSDVTTELGAAKASSDRYGGTHFSYKQLYKGVPVLGAELKTHFDASGNLVVVNGTFIPGINLDAQPSRSAEEASKVALARVKEDLGARVSAKGLTTQATLMVYREGLLKGVEGANHLVWQVEVSNRFDVRDFVYVDAHSGKIVEKIAGIQEAKFRRAYNAAGATAPGANYPGNPFWIEGQAFPTGTAEADNMIQASSEIYDLFKIAFGRDSYNGAGAVMDSIFNRGNACPNASWNGTFISFCPGLTTDDVTAHEWGHAYTEYTHGLIYAWQSGALNESYSDIWGETVDRLNGRGTDTPDALRTAGSCTAFTSATQINITAPASIAGGRAAGSAAFGPQTFSLAATDVVVVNDGVVAAGGGTTTDGCETPFANAAAIVGKIAYVDRGSCGFSVKAANAEAAGAIGVIVGNNAAGIANMSATAGTVNNVPSLLVSQADGTLIKGATGVKASMLRGPGTDNSVRWLVGEDSTAVGLSGALRDMYNPTCYGNPGKVSDPQYSCGPNTQAGDSGGVHTNSGVPNHAYALLVDGGTYNGQTVGAIGLTKAAHIYFRAQTVYQYSASNFSDHADALQQSCADLTGQALPDLKTGVPGEIISAFDCSQIPKAMTAVEMRATPACSFVPLLQPNPPALCEAGTVVSTLASDNFEGGKRASIRWILSNQGSTSTFTPRNWGVVRSMPGRTGYGIFAVNYAGGNCTATGDESGVMRLETPEIVVPAGAAGTRLSFDHNMASEASYDGGNVKISVNGGAWQLVSAANFIFNPYNTTLTTAAGGNTNPLAGQAAFSGADGGSNSGSWGRSIVNLAPYASAGDRIKLRFEMGSDGCGGTFGWYLDDVTVYRCVAP